jgi:hypothetical protein
MSNPNTLPSNRAVSYDKIAPISQGAGTVTTGWLSMQTVDEILAVISCGVLGASATVDAKLQQATDAAGTGVKDVTSKAITQLVKATDDGKSAQINCRSDELDNNFAFVRLSVTVGAAASLIAAEVRAFDARNQPLAQATSMKQTVA